MNHIARVKLNNKDLGVIWTASRTVKIPAGLLEVKANKLEIEVTNVWDNRLIGDEQEPADMEWTPNPMGWCLFFKRISRLVPEKPTSSLQRQVLLYYLELFYKRFAIISSGLLGPVTILKEQ